MPQPARQRRVWASRGSRDDFEGGAEMVFAEGLRGAEQIALAVDNHAQRVFSVGGSEFMDHAVRPLAALLRSQLEHDSALVSVAIGQASVRSAVEVSRLVEHHRIAGIAAVRAV